MTRKPDPTRKPQLIADIIDYVLDKTLASITLRGLADALGVSTFTLVYHFGSRDELIAAVVEAICDEQTRELNLADFTDDSVEVYFERFEHYWKWAVKPRSQQLQRIVIEQAMSESLQPGRSATRDSLKTWHESALHGLLALGVDKKTAQREARAHANALYGLHYDLIVSGDTKIVTEAFLHCMDAYRRRIEALVETLERDPGDPTDASTEPAVAS